MSSFGDLSEIFKNKQGIKVLFYKYIKHLLGSKD